MLTIINSTQNYYKSMSSISHKAKTSYIPQVIPGVKYLSGERWVHQCMECECLAGEIDCWPLQCPSVCPLLSSSTPACCLAPLGDQSCVYTHPNVTEGCTDCAPKVGSKKHSFDSRLSASIYIYIRFTIFISYIHMYSLCQFS